MLDNLSDARSFAEADPDGLTPRLRAAQAAMALPEVQEMLRRLSAHNLGIYMPHAHDDATGAFLDLPENIIQIESGQVVSFAPAATVDRSRYVEVGWVWAGDGATVTMGCKMICEKRPGDTMHYNKHEGKSS